MKPAGARISIAHNLTLADGRHVHVREWPGRGRPLVLLHGLLESSAGWDELARVSPHRCLAVDLPGFGKSDPPSRPRLSAYAEDIATAVEKLGAGSFTLVGHSLGGGVATALAEHMPHQVAALVLCAPVGFGRLPLAELVAIPPVAALAVAALPLLATRGLVIDVVYRAMVTGGVSPSEKLRTQLARDASRLGPGLRAAVIALAAAGRSETAFHRRRISYGGPVSVLWGERDALVPVEHARSLMRSLPQAEVQIRSGMGHHPQREQPGTLERLVEAAQRRGDDYAESHPSPAERRLPSTERRLPSAERRLASAERRLASAALVG